MLDRLGLFVLPNTAGCYTARDAVRTAQLAREAFATDWIKLELIGDDRTLLPDSVELIDAASELVDDGFIVLPYTNDDPVLARRGGRRLRGGDAAGRADRLGGRAPQPLNLRIIVESARVPVILDRDIGNRLRCDARDGARLLGSAAGEPVSGPRIRS